MKTSKQNKIRKPVAKAIHRHARVAPRKARLVSDQIRGLNVVQALGILENIRKGPNPIVKNVLKSAIANAMKKNSSLEPDTLIITEATVDKGRTLKRIRPRAMGRAARILKHSSHIMLSVG